MASSMASMQEERTIAEVQRLSRAALAAPALLQRVVHAVYRAVPFDFYSAATIDPASSLITHAFSEVMGHGKNERRSVNPAWFEHYYFEAAYQQTISLVQRGLWATTIHDETEGRPDRSLCYRESTRPAGVEHQAQAVFVDRHLWGDLDLYRAVGRPGFTPRELALLRRVAPEVGSGLKVAALQAEGMAGGTSEATPGVLMIDPQGRVTATPAGERLLGELDELHPRWREGRELPSAIHVVLGALRQSLKTGSAGEQRVAPQMQVRARSGRWLSLNASESEAAEGRPAERFVIITPARPREIVWLGMTAYDLSPREEEVVRLVVGGGSTKHIAGELFIAEHTVQRHLSNIFEKVGVRSRRDLVKQLFVEHVLPTLS